MLLPKAIYKRTGNKDSRIATPAVRKFAGYNANPVIGEGELKGMSNCSSRNFPCISPRASRSQVTTVTTPNALYAANGKLCWVDGVSFYYDGVYKGAVTSGAKSIVDFNGKILIFPDKKYYDYGANLFGNIDTGKLFMQMGDLDATGILIASTTKLTTYYPILLNGGTSYTLANDKSLTTATVYYYDTNMTFISSAAVTFGVAFTIATGAAYMHIVITYTDLFIVMTINNTVYPSMGRCPDMDYVCVETNRVFGVKNSVVYACAIGDMTDWTTFLPNDELGSFKGDVLTEGNFTGIVQYSGHVVAFKIDSMYEIYGDNPINYNIKPVAKKGCIDYNSICEVNGLLFFLARDGVNAYGGGMPRLMSTQLNEAYISGVAGTDGRKYFLSLYNGSVYALYVYDTLFGVWHKEDALRVVGFAWLSGYLYALSNETTSKIWKFGYGTETVSWNAETDIFDEGNFNKKYYSKIMVKVELSAGSTLDVYIKIDNGAYVLEKSYVTAQLQVISHNFLPKRCNNFQLKFVGSGDAKVYQVERWVEVGSDV